MTSLKNGRLERALDRRQPLAGRADLTAYRLINGAGDGFPGVAVDRFDDTLILHAESDAATAEVLPMLARSSGARRVYVKRHPKQTSRLGQAERLALAPPIPAWGHPVEQTPVVEHGVRYLVRAAEGLSVGLFVDMRDVRRWVRERAHGHSVLNLFAYTCAFGVCARLGGAARVVNLDASRAYLAWGTENYASNGLTAEPRDFVYGDTFDWLGRFARRGERFDVVIVDPPSFGSTRAGPFSVERDYERLVAAAARVTAPAGILVAATNHRGVPATRFDAFVDRGLETARRGGRRIRRWHEPALDFPVAPGQRPYLKVQALELD